MGLSLFHSLPLFLPTSVPSLQAFFEKQLCVCVCVCVCDRWGGRETGSVCSHAQSLLPQLRATMLKCEIKEVCDFVLRYAVLLYQ